MSDELNDLPIDVEPCSIGQTRTMVSNPELDQILDQYLDDLQNGRACSREELLAQYPDLADELAEYLDGIEMVSGLGIGSDLVPQRLGDFEIIRPIGRGAMGVVYLANQISLKRPVALKVLRYSVTGKQATARFEREAELVATLQHANIVPIHATGKHDNLHFLAMQLIEGPSLSQWSAAEDADRDPVTLAKWGAEVARALAHAHQRDVIHRDVKPSNLLQDEDQKIWLTDFGLARRFDDLRMSMTGAMLGTPNYMSPEQASPTRHPIDHRTDIYSLGATLFELLTGRCVFLAETPHAVLAQVLAEEPPMLRELIPDASRDLETILMKCLEREPGDRYQTADQLADDLEAFATGYSIKARRPSVIEQAIRWKRQNQKAVSWALTAASAAIVMLLVSAASWIGWTNSQMGSLKIKSDEGPIVGRLIDADGEPTPIFSIPTEQPLPIKEGRYTLQTWASGRMGVNQELSIDCGQVTETFSRMFDDTVFPERTVQGIPAVLPLGDRDDLVFFHNQGLTRVDGRTGKDLWTALVSEFAEKGYVWRVGNRDINHRSRLASFPDINADGYPEILVPNDLHPTLIVVDGKTGELLWRYLATPSTGDPRAYSGALHMPLDIGDVDGDGFEDFATCFRAGMKFEQWLDVVSGKTGKRIWRRQLPAKPLGESGNILTSFCQVNDLGDSPPVSLRSGGRYRDGIMYDSTRSMYNNATAWPPITLSGKNGSKDFLLLACGSELIVCDAKTGQATDFNQGQPLELGFVPAIEPKLVTSGQGDKQPIGVLLCEIVSRPDANEKAKPVTRFSIRSLETAEELWHFDSACDLNWTGIKPDWPLVTDLTGDGVPEILIAAGADLENDRNASRLASLQALDARTGQPLWDTKDVAKIRSQDRQVQRLLMGPDADADTMDDVYVVSPMLDRGPDVTSTSVYIDILSAATGKRIRTTRSEVPVFAKMVDFERPFFLGVGSDGHPRLVVATMRTQTNPARQSTVLISTGTGMSTNVGDELEYPLHADGDGDGVRDLFLVKPRNRRKISESGQLLAIKSNGGREQIFAKGNYLRTDDVDGDGVHDLLNKRTWQQISGATGERIRRWSFRLRGEKSKVKLLDDDVDGDEIKDFLVAESSGNGNGHRVLLTLVSGREGRVVWQKQFLTSSSSIEDFSVSCDDMNGDGAIDLVLLHRFSPLRDLLRISCFDGQTGTEHWEAELGRANLFGNRSDRDSVFITDINEDGFPDVLCQPISGDTVALKGRSGNLLWKQQLITGDTKSPTDPVTWRSKILSLGPNKRNQVVTATADKGTVRVNIHDLIDGQRVSTWLGDGRLRVVQYDRDSPLDLCNGTPFAVKDGENRYAGVCFQGSGQLQLVVFETSTTEAKVVQRIDIPKPNIKSNKFRHSKIFLIADVNDDGRTDVVFHNGSDLVVTDLISNKEITRKHMPASYPRLSPVGFDRSLLQLTTSEGTVNREGEYDQLKLIDMKTFEVVWDLHSPPNVFVDGLLSAGRPKVSNLKSTLPRILYRGNPDSLRVVGSEDDYLGNNEQVRQQILQTAATPVSFSSATFYDPRMVETLPWVQESKMSRNQLNEMIQGMTSGLLIVLGAVVFPFFFIRKMIIQKCWNLKTFLLWPLLFAVPYLVLQLPLEVGGDFRLDGAHWKGKLLASCLLILPCLGFVAVWVEQLWRGNWKRLSLLSIAPFAIAIFIGAMLLLGQKQLPPGSYYDWYDFGSIKLVASGVYCSGLVVVGTWFFMFVGEAINGLRKRIFSRSRLIAS